MEPSHTYRPRVPRETRLLLAAAVLAVAVLWLLARVRFPDRPATPNPITPVLTQLAGGPSLEDLASEVSQLQLRLEPWLLTSELTGPPYVVPALRIREEVALALDPLESSAVDGPDVLARDRATGLTLLRAPSTPVAALTSWSLRRPQPSRFLMATDVLGRSVVLRPVFVSGFEPVNTPEWREPVWRVPGHTDLAPAHSCLRAMQSWRDWSFGRRETW